MRSTLAMRRVAERDLLLGIVHFQRQRADAVADHHPGIGGAVVAHEERDVAHRHRGARVDIGERARPHQKAEARREIAHEETFVVGADQVAHRIWSTAASRSMAKR